MTEDLPYSGACERNREPILSVLQRHLDRAGHVLEIGSGTGQHAAHFSRAMPHLVWQTSDLAENHPGILAWMREAKTPNLRAPLTLDVRTGPWPTSPLDAVFSANTLHIMSWHAVTCLFAALPAVLRDDARVIIYGPFRYDGRATSESNEAFDLALRHADPQRGVRDFEAVDACARDAGLVLLEDVAMPANNRCLVWRYDARRTG